VLAEVQSARQRDARRRVGLFQVRFSDATGVCSPASGFTADIWRTFRAGQRVSLFGKVSSIPHRPSGHDAPEYEILSGSDEESDASAHEEACTPGGIVPIYEAAGKSSTRARARWNHAFWAASRIADDPLPRTFSTAETAGPVASIRDLHFPPPGAPAAAERLPLAGAIPLISRIFG